MSISSDFLYYFMIGDYRHIHIICWYLCTCRGIVTHVHHTLLSEV